MKVESRVIEQIHLDPGYALLSVQNIITTMELFHCLDIHGKKCLNDMQFEYFMKQVTDLHSKSEIEVIFKLLDVDQSGEIEFDEFYLIFCVMVACKDQYEKEFIYRHSNSIFQLIDQDSSGHISSEEFSNMGILFNFDRSSIMSIFNEFDISGDKNLDFSEFRLFTMACIDEQRGIEAASKVNAFRDYNNRLIENLKPTIKRYIQTRSLPPPLELEVAVDSTEPPYIKQTRYRKNWRSRLWDFFNSIKPWIVSVYRRITTCCKKCCCIFKCRRKSHRGYSQLKNRPKSKSKSKSNQLTTNKEKKSAKNGEHGNCSCLSCCWRRRKKKQEEDRSSFENVGERKSLIGARNKIHTTTYNEEGESRTKDTLILSPSKVKASRTSWKKNRLEVNPPSLTASSASGSTASDNHTFTRRRQAQADATRSFRVKKFD